MKNKWKKNAKRNIRISVLTIILIFFSAWFVFATAGTEYNKSRKITINMAGGNTPTMRWMYKYDRTPPSGASTSTYFTGVATGKVTDKNGYEHILGKGRLLERNPDKYAHPNRAYPFSGNQNPRVGTFTQHMDFVGQTPYIWIANPTRTGYKFDGWTVSPSRPSNPVSYTLNGTSGTLIHAGYSGGNFTITAKWVDNIAPTVTISPNSRDWGNSNISASVSMSDSGSGFRRHRYRVETNGSWGSWNSWSTSSTRSLSWSTNGSRRVQIEAQDNAGNTRTVTSGYFRIDKTQPSVTISPNSRSWGNSNVSASVSMSDSGGSGFRRHRYRVETNGSWGSWNSWSTSSTRSLSWSTNGSRRVQIEAQDNAGNTRTVTSGYFRIDKTKPTITASPADRGWGNSNVTVTLNFSDSQSGVSTRQYAWSTSTSTPSSWNTYSSAVTQSSNGTWYLHARAVDGAGNVTTQRFGPYRIDKTAPTISASPSSRDWDNTDVTVSLTFTDEHSGVSTRQYAWSTSTTTPSSWSWYTYSSAVTQSSNGTWYLHARAVDGAGNVTTQRFGPYRIDKDTPTHTSHSITGFRYKDGNDYWVRANDTVKYKMRGYDSLSGIRYSYARLTAPDVDVRSQHDWNAASNHNNQLQTNEQIEITSAARTYNADGYREVEWTIESKDHENDFEIYYDYRDNVGNNLGYGNTGMRLRVDTTKPTVSLSSESGAMIPSDEITITATDSRSGLKYIRYKWSESPITPTSWIDASGQIVNNVAVVKTNPPHPGEKMYLHYYAEDQVGNITVGYAGHYNVVDDTVSIDGLALIKVVNPPRGTKVPVIYPVDEPPVISAGYKLDFITTVTGADAIDVRLYDQEGEMVTLYTDEGEFETLTLPIATHNQTNRRFTFWLDKEMEEGTVLDMELVLRRSLPGNRSSIIGNSSLGKKALMIGGSSKKDSRINLTK